MAPIERYTQSFLIRIWLEEEPSVSKKGLWRGHITCVNGEDRRYLRSLEDILSYIAPHIRAWGIKPKLHLRVLLWINSLKRRKWF